MNINDINPLHMEAHLKGGPLCYLASPYSLYQGGIQQAFEDVSRLAAKLMLAGVKVYSPIAHTHPLAIYGGVDPFDHSIWMPFDEAMMNACDVLLVSEMDGWKESKGIAHEIEFFDRRNKQIFRLNPESLAVVVWPRAAEGGAG